MCLIICPLKVFLNKLLGLSIDEKQLRGSSNYENKKVKERKMRHEVNVGVIRIIFKIISGIMHLSSSRLDNYPLIVLS
jgi:hypothetical protein